MRIAVSCLGRMVCSERGVHPACGGGTLAAPTLVPCLVSSQSAGRRLVSTASTLSLSAASMPDAGAGLMSAAQHLVQPEHSLAPPATNMPWASLTLSAPVHGSCHQIRE